MASEFTVGDVLGKHWDVSFDEPEPAINRKETLLGVIISFMLLSWIAVCFRLYIRFRVTRSLGWDDLFVGLYLITTTMCSVTVSLGPEFGLGRHILTLYLSEFTNFLHAFYFMNASYISSTALIKLSLLFQYLRLFEKGTRMRNICIGVIILTLLWGIAFTFVGWFPCFPPTDYWEKPLGSSCYGYGVGMTNSDQFAITFESQAISNTVLDFIVLFLAFYLLRGTERNSKTRVGLMALLLVGAIVNSFSIWRLVTVIEHKAGFFPAEDPTWYGPISITLAVLEVNVAAICASIPIFWPVLETQFGRIFITQEVKITSEDRWQSVDDQSVSELTNSRSRQNRSRGDSDVEIAEPEALQKVTSNRGDRYYDDYMMQQIDPLRDQKGSMRDARATTQSPNAARRKWWRLV